MCLMIAITHSSCNDTCHSRHPLPASTSENAYHSNPLSLPVNHNIPNKHCRRHSDDVLSDSNWNQSYQAPLKSLLILPHLHTQPDGPATSALCFLHYTDLPFIHLMSCQKFIAFGIQSDILKISCIFSCISKSSHKP